MNEERLIREDKHLPVSRRTFLAGVGTFAATSAAQGPMETLTGGFLVTRHEEPVAATTRGPFGALHFEDLFAPTEGWVRPAERPWRDEICLNGDWQFQSAALPEGFEEGHDPAPSLPIVDAARWEKTPLSVPSPWNVNSFADHQGQGGDFRCYPSYPREWEEVRMGWLRRSFTVPASWKGCTIFLHFDAVAGRAEVLVNGKSIGTNFDNFLPFDLDVTEAILPGELNEVLVGVRKASLFDRRGTHGRRTYQGGSFWGQHIAGIWQDVFLLAMPSVYVADVFVQPFVDSDLLRVEVSVANTGDEPADVTLDAQAFRWKSKAGDTPLTAPLPSSELGGEPALALPAVRLKIPAHDRASAVLQSAVKGQLHLWKSNDPHLYGLVIQIQHQKKTIDSKYTRFGWRQISIRGSAVLLNGEPIVLRGDSWHFMGIPQMTRRYAWAWFSTLLSAGLNAVRLHAQPYPAFYLDVADEMGLLVLDETAIWASDAGPKLDDPAFWQDTERHLAALVQRDRNHPSVFGWSVSNEMRPIVLSVMRNPPGLMDELLRHYAIWAEICRKHDSTRPWISADGEEDGDGRLPVFNVHYGGPQDMARALASGKPWGVGEAGNAYYATPVEVAETNGERAYESFEGRMEGVAISSYRALIDQRKYRAIYRSVFNLVWYGLQPLALGMKDLTRPPSLDDGIFFDRVKDGRPGVQPQRLGPYCTTLNPGYDASLPMYVPWPLFEAICDAAAEPPNVGRWSPPAQPEPPQVTPIGPISSVRVLAGEGSVLTDCLRSLGLPAETFISRGSAPLLLVDGTRPPGPDANDVIAKAFRTGSTVLVWGATPDTAAALSWLPAPFTVTQRAASSLLLGISSPITGGLRPDNLYFCDQTPPLITEAELSGPLIDSCEVLLHDCKTNWLMWNNQPEYAKTAMALRSEREARSLGIVLALKRMDAGWLLITTLPVAPATLRAQNVSRTLLSNLGVSLHAGMDQGKPLSHTGTLVRTLACGFFPSRSEPDPLSDPDSFAHLQDSDFRAGSTFAGKQWQPVFAENGVFDFTGASDDSEVWGSFWVYSPRSLNDLLLQPNMPRVDFHASHHDAMQVWLNRDLILDTTGHLGDSVAHSLQLRAGWNHILLLLKHRTGHWNFSASFTASPEFLAQLDSSFAKP